jgi:dihydroxynaphthoic acid synthetase
MKFDDILYEIDDATAIITINRPKALNSFTNHTVNELTAAFGAAWANRAVAAVIFTGTGDRAFSTGGDQSSRTEGGYDIEARSESGTDICELHSIIRDIPKPVIAAVNGYAIGGGHVLHVLCDLTIAADTAIFGQVGPKVGSFDAGFGTGYLAAVIGEKRAREMWFLCRRYSAEQALSMGLVNAVVPAAELIAEAKRWAQEIADMSPTALRFLKQSFNVATEALRATSAIGMSAVGLYYGTAESVEGRNAFVERRKPAFRG